MTGGGGVSTPGDRFRRPAIVIAFVLMVMSLLACGGGGGTANVKEVQRASTGAFDVVLLAGGDALQSGKDTAVLEFRSRASQALVDVGAVNVAANMPMAGMPPMFGTLELQPSGTPGRYLVNSNFGMAGTWQINVEWEGQTGKGSTTLRGAVR